MHRIQKVGFINKIEYLFKVKKYLESLIFSDFEKWLVKSTKVKFRETLKGLMWMLLHFFHQNFTNFQCSKKSFKTFHKNIWKKKGKEKISTIFLTFSPKNKTQTTRENLQIMPTRVCFETTIIPGS
jgi:hypothetical protein